MCAEARLASNPGPDYSGGMTEKDSLESRFVKHCHTHLAELRPVRAEMPPLPAGEAGKAFHLIVHSIAGSAGMFGFPKAGERAAEVETALLDEPVDPEEVAKRLDMLIAELEAITTANG